MLNNEKIEVVIISYNTCELTLQCIDSVLATKGDLDLSITIVDNASSDNTVIEVQSRYPALNIIENEKNIGYASAVNIGVNSTDAPFVIISNSDVVYHKLAMQNMLEYLFDNPKVGVAGPQQIFPDGSWQNSYGDLPSIKLGLKNLLFISAFLKFIKKFSWHKFKIDRRIKQVGYIDGAVHAIRKEYFDLLGGYDEDYFFYTEEADFCKKLKKAGLKVMFFPDATVTHLRGGSSIPLAGDIDKIRMLIRSKLLYCWKHLGFQQTKLYLILEIFSSCNMFFAWTIIYLLSFGEFRSKARNKKNIMNIFFVVWTEEFFKVISE